MCVDVVHGVPDALIHPHVPLTREPRPQQIQRVRNSRGDSTCACACGGVLQGVWDWESAGSDEAGALSEGEELGSAVGEVEKLGGDVAFPEAGDALLF